MIPVEHAQPWNPNEHSERIEHPCKQLRNVQRTRRAATITVDDHLRLERFDRGAAEAFGLSHEDLGSPLGPLVTYLNLDAEDVEWCLRYVIAEGTSLECELELKGGRRFEVMIQPFVTDGGRLAGAVLTLTDVTHLKRVHEHLKRVADSVQELPTPFIILDEKWTIITWNHGAETTYGYTPEEIIGKSYLMLVPEDIRESEEARMERWRRGEHVEAAAGERIRKDGRVFPVQHELSRVEDTTRTLLAVSDRDITEQIEAERRRDFLLRELDHRVKNVLTIVLGILERTAATSESIESFVPTFRDRINALAVAHRTLASGHWEGAPLRELVSRVMRPLARQERIRTSGEDVMLPASVISPLAMALHELATNALRHGALSREGGRVSLDWSVKDHDTIHVLWKESGGPRVQPPEKPGFGTRLIQNSIPYEIGGSTSLEFYPEGVQCEIEAPLEGPGAER